MVIYFTGTGNSQYIAEALADRLKDKLIRANDIIKQNKKGVFKSKRPYVFVFPVYASTIAGIFSEFIERSRFEGNRKAYFIATCASEMGAVPNNGIRICKEKGLEYMGASAVIMPQNYVIFPMTPPAECKKRIAAALDTADSISRDIIGGNKLETKPVSDFEYYCTDIVAELYNRYFTSSKNFFASDSCVGCGMCEKLCPKNNIVLRDGKPVWGGSCVHCMSCVNRCPKSAIEYGKKTIGIERYFCEKYAPKKRS